MRALWREEADTGDEPASEEAERVRGGSQAHAAHASISSLASHGTPQFMFDEEPPAGTAIGTDKTYQASAAMARPIISVVIPTCSRHDLLERCLAALFAQTLDPTDYEILVADDARCDDTRRQVERWALRASEQGVAVRYVPVTSGRGPAAARNAGWRAARGALIAFTDDDCVPEPGWLRAGVDALADGVAGAAGRLVLPLPSDPTDYEVNAARLARAEFVTANCFYRRATLQRVGGFDERFAMAWREDTDLYFRLLASGETLKHAPDAVVTHPIRFAAWGVSLRQQRKSQFNALLYKKHPALYRAHVQAAPPWHYYAIIALALAALTAGVLGHGWLATLCAVGWAALTTLFCLQRLRGTSRAPTHVLEMIVTSALIPWLAVFWRVYGAVKYRVWFL